jgi:hypothetical protein
MDAPALAGMARWDALLSGCPLFKDFEPYRGFFVEPDIDRMNVLLAECEHGASLRFAAQTPSLLADGLHYEQRTAERGIIATRDRVTHDLFNAIMWLRHAALKRAMNSRQVADIARVGTKQRTRGQCALTHFDEAGAIVWLAGPDLVAAWNAHDWPALFLKNRAAWDLRIAVTVIGHALFDYALEHGEAPVAKALAVHVDEAEIAARSDSASIPVWPYPERWLAGAIESGRLLADPQELRPLPLAGIPGWHIGEQSETFYTTAPCFRPLRPGRRYPTPLKYTDADAVESASRQAAIG